MDFKTIAEHMYPFWILGVLIILTVLAAGQKKLIRIEKQAIKKWMFFLLYVSAWRLLLSKVFHFNGIGDLKAMAALPIPMTLTVFWEDACHGLPLLILKKLIGKRKWLKPLYWFMLIATMIEFGSGHMYQGILPAMLLSFYVPYSIKMGNKYGFGTVMLCHMTYDASTLLLIQHMLAK